MGALYTVLTNAKNRCQKNSLIAMIQGVKSSNICEIKIDYNDTPPIIFIEPLLKTYK
ncbi:MAG: hypothetical protein J7J86_02355 [Bacteroidales bacterium]|nr:hypothetical protein [Bacteroidales bacterium]